VVLRYWKWSRHWPMAGWASRVPASRADPAAVNKEKGEGIRAGITQVTTRKQVDRYGISVRAWNAERPEITGRSVGGRVRIRTAVAAFAELCLTPRPRDHGIRMVKADQGGAKITGSALPLHGIHHAVHRPCDRWVLLFQPHPPMEAVGPFLLELRKDAGGHVFHQVGTLGHLFHHDRRHAAIINGFR